MCALCGCRGSQLGAEGLIIGSGYVAFSACIALLMYAVPRARSKATRTVLGYGLVIAAAYLSSRLFSVRNCAYCAHVPMRAGACMTGMQVLQASRHLPNTPLLMLLQIYSGKTGYHISSYLLR